MPVMLSAQINPANITIARDSFGVPHIFAPTDAEGAYGLAWAHAEDDFNSIQQVALPARGMMGRAYGKKGAVGDYVFRLLRCREITEEKWHTLSPQFIRLIEGYVQGLNDYAAAHPKEVLVKGLFPVSTKEYIASSVLAVSVFNGAERALTSIMNGTAPKALESDPKGSNAIAVHPTKTNTGEAFLVVNAHQPNEGPQAFYEAHVCTDEGWNVLGGLLAGGPCILHGANEHLGWAHTVNNVDRVDVYQLKINPNNSNQYRFDGQWLNLEKAKVKLKVKGVPVSIKRVAYWCKYGATIKTKQGVFAIRMGANMEIRALEQWYRMNKAKNFSQFYEALSMQGLSMFNIVYADRHDTIFYVNNALVPIRDTAAQFNWRSTLPGNTSRTLWTQFKKLNELPQYVNPGSGYLFNTNHSPFLATAPGYNLNPAKYSKADGWEMYHNNRSLRFNELMPEQEKIDMDKLKAIKFDKRYPQRLAFGVIIDSMYAVDPEAYPQWRSVIENFQQWDRNGVPDSKGAAVFLLSYHHMQNRQGGPISKAEALATYEAAHNYQMQHFGHSQATLGNVQKLVRGNDEQPMYGLPDVLAAEYSVPYKKGLRKVTVGDAYIMFIRYRKTGLPVIETINTYGASARPESPHFADQMPLYMQQKTKPMTLDKQLVLQTAEGIYHPGK